MNFVQRLTLTLTGAVLCSAASNAAFAATATAVPTAPPAAVPAATLSSTANAAVIYGGDPLTSGGPIQAAAWGGGMAADSSGNGFTTSGHAIKVDTAGLYQGGHIQFNPGITLGDLKSDKSRFLVFIVNLAASSKYTGYSGGATAVTAMPSPTDMSRHFSFDGRSIEVAAGGGGFPGGFPGMGGGRGRFPGGMSRGGAIQPQNPSAAPAQVILPIRQMHIIFQFSDGAQAEMLRPVNAGAGDINWLHVAVPLAAIPAPTATAGNATLKSISIGTDVPAQVTVGEILLAQNSTPISAFAGNDETDPVNTPVNFDATGDGGVSALVFDWDFDTNGDFESMAQGQNITHTFTKAGDYKVTLRVSDLDGIKDPVTSTMNIHIDAP